MFFTTMKTLVIRKISNHTHPVDRSGAGWVCCKCKKITSKTVMKCHGCQHQICYYCKLNEEPKRG